MCKLSILINSHSRLTRAWELRNLICKLTILINSHSRLSKARELTKLICKLSTLINSYPCLTLAWELTELVCKLSTLINSHSPYLRSRRRCSRSAVDLACCLDAAFCLSLQAWHPRHEPRLALFWRVWDWSCRNLAFCFGSCFLFLFRRSKESTLSTHKKGSQLLVSQ